MFNHHIDMTAYDNFIALSTNFPDSPRTSKILIKQGLVFEYSNVYDNKMYMSYDLYS
jgi:hypothetical protein